jgi:hypothetical protein
MEEILIQLVAKYPHAMALFTFMGVLRAIFKPLMTLLRSYADATETKRDNELLDSVESSKLYGYVRFAIDYLASIKLPVKK